MRPLAVAAVLLLAAPVNAQTLAEVRLGDGSSVRVTVLTAYLDVKTKYGTLTVPMSDVRKAEFGLHLREEVAAKLEAASKSLASAAFKERDEAGKALLGLGGLSAPTLRRLASGQDLEAATRANSLLKQLRDAGAELDRKEEDTIHTDGLTIIGRAQAKGLQVRSAIFGETLLHLADLRTLHIIPANNAHEITLDADWFGAEGDKWHNTGLRMNPRCHLHVTAEGQVDLWPQTPGQYMATPKGMTFNGKNSSFAAGSLLLKFGETSAVYVGERKEIAGGPDEPIYLQILPSPWGQPSSGSYRVRLRMEPK